MKILSKKFLFLSTLFFVGLGLFVFTPRSLNAGTDYIPAGYFQCSTHGFHQEKDCGMVSDYFPKANYTAGAISYQFLGHRHGSSEINATICLLYANPYAPGGDCRYYTCSGAQCGNEYGGDHPWNLLGGDSFVVQGNPANGGFTGFYIMREAFVEDAEVRIVASASADYPNIVPGGDPIPPPPPASTPTPGDFSLSVNGCVSGSNNTDLSWSASQNATSYDIYAKAWTTGTWNKVGSVAGTSFRVAQVWDTDYYYYVKAINSAGTKDSDPNGGIFGGNCPSDPPPPPPPGGYPPPVCSPSTQTVRAGTNASFSATGGNGGYVWSAPSGSPTSGGAASFTTRYGAPGTYTVSVSSANQTASCAITVINSLSAASVWVDKPVCSNDPYTATINWNGISPHATYGYFIDVGVDSGFNKYWNKRIPNPTGAVSTTALSGFSCDSVNFCESYNVPAEVMSLQPDKIYYTRLYAGSGTHYPSAAGVSFMVPRCSPLIPAPTKPVWVGAPVCAASTGTYVVNIDWEGAPNPSFGTWIDIDTDSNWDDTNLYDWWNKNIPVSSPLTESNSNGFDGLYPETGDRLIMRPGTNYFARMYTAQPAWGVHSATSDVLNVPICTLDATLVASPSSGTGPLSVTLTATKTAGSASGLITYQFDCTNDGTYEGTVGPTSSVTASYAGCPAYPSRGTTYVARVKITQKDVFGQDVPEEKTALIASGVVAKPNLKALGVEPNMLNMGVDQTLLSRVSNESDVDVSTDFPYYFAISASSAGAGPYVNKPASTMVATVGANSTTLVSVSHSFPTAGTYSARLCVDKTSPSGGGVIDESNEDDNCGPWSDISVSNTIPSVGNVTISSPIVNPNNTNQYTIKISGTDLSGYSDLKYLEVLINGNNNINGNGANAGQYRGLLIWNTGVAQFAALESKSCGGGTGYIFASNYNPSYLHLVSCSVSDSGNTREVSFVVRFDTTFTTPLTDNDMSGIVGDNSNQFSPWVNFNGFDLVSSSPSGTLTVPTCVIATGASTCSTNVSWSTQNLVGGDVITVRKDNVNILSGNSNPGVSNTLTWGAHTFLLVRNGNLATPLDNEAVNVDCNPAVATWNGAICQANAVQFDVSVTKTPSSGGTVTGGAINCGNVCSAQFSQNSNVTLTAVPKSSYWQFDRWTGDCSGTSPICTFTVNGTKSVQAEFSLRDFQYHEF